MRDLNSPLLIPALILSAILVAVALGAMVTSIWYRRANRQQDIDDMGRLALWCMVAAIILPLVANIAPLFFQALIHAFTK